VLARVGQFFFSKVHRDDFVAGDMYLVAISGDDDESRYQLSVERKGTAPLRKRLTMQQKLKAIQHFEKNRTVFEGHRKDLGEFTFKGLMLKKKSSKSSIAKMFRPKNFARINFFEYQTSPHLLQQKSANQSRFPELKDKLTGWFSKN
jgi:hypothetical protein